MAGQLLRRALTVALVVLGAGAVFSCTSTNKMQDEDKARDFALSPVIAGPASLLVPRSAQAAGKAQAQVPHGTVCNLKGRLGGSQAGLKVHILGDSHMASDDFSERLKAKLGDDFQGELS